jgi:hypothetical protein
MSQYPKIINETAPMPYESLPPKHKQTALQWAVDAWNEIYREQGIAEIDETAPEVQQYVKDQQYVIQTIQFTRRVAGEELQYGE